MAKVTGGGETTTIGVFSIDDIAQALADIVSAGLADGSLTRTTGTANPPTGLGVLTITAQNTTVTTPQAVGVDLIAGGAPAFGPAPSVTVLGNGLPRQVVIGDGENITYLTNGGGGAVVLGDGDNLVATPTVGGGDLSVTTGSGADTIRIYSGNATVSPSGRQVSFDLPRSNEIDTGLPGTQSNVLVFASGFNTIRSSGGSGTDTVIAGTNFAFRTANASHVSINEASKDLVYNGEASGLSADIKMGAGSATIFAGTAQGEFSPFFGTGGPYVLSGGSAGHNLILGGTGSAPTTIFGGGHGDVLMARSKPLATAFAFASLPGAGRTLIVAGTGNETLSGAASTSNNIFAAGVGGNTTIGGGVGDDTIYAGNPGATAAFGGNIVIDGGLGNDLISFGNRGSGVTATVLINDFAASDAGENDRIQLIGFDLSQRDLVRSAAASAGTVTLQDGTRLSFGTAALLTEANFA